MSHRANAALPTISSSLVHRAANPAQQVVTNRARRSTDQRLSGVDQTCQALPLACRTLERTGSAAARKAGRP